MAFEKALRGLKETELLSAAEALLRLLDGGEQRSPGGLASGAAGTAERGAARWDGPVTPDPAFRAVQTTDTTLPEARAAAERAAEERQRLAESLEALSRERQRTVPAPSGITTPAAAETGGGAVGAAASRETRFAVAGEIDPEAVSEFFRRDSRRYDSGFGGRDK